MSSAKPKTIKRAVHGILLLDKPPGISSNAALQMVKRLYRAEKAGHTGNLDPLATGMLPICLGEATKISAFLLEGDKHYQTRCRLGITTDSADSEGRIIAARPVPVFKHKRIEQVLRRFRGEIQQIPPMYSALKYQGQPLYKLARQGLEIERAPRTVHIYRLELLQIEAESLQLDVECSKGTYIRTLVEDIGRELGCGAHVIELRRLASRPFTPPMYTLQALQKIAAAGGETALDRVLQPADAALSGMPLVVLTTAMAGFVRQGQAVQVSQAPDEGLLRMYCRQQDRDEFLGIGQVLDDGRISPKRLIFSQ